MCMRTTIWNYREGYVTTTDPGVAGMIGIAAACVGVATLIWAMQSEQRRPPRPRLTRGRWS
jgi:hypothetical protein